MEDSFFAYLNDMELLAFFAGYPLLFAVVSYLFSLKKVVRHTRLTTTYLLSFTYALTGTLYVAWQLKNRYPGFPGEWFHMPWQNYWAMLSLLCWIPAIARFKWISLLHSLVFFYPLLRNVWLHLYQPAHASLLSNDMQMYSFSLLVNVCSLLAIVLFSFLAVRVTKARK